MRYSFPWPLLLAVLSLSSCIAHAPEQVAGPDVVSAEGEWPQWPVRVEEDRWGIPHIRARSAVDASWALGLLHAEERLWQMELSRRIGSGRLSELFGKRSLGTDRFLRTLGLRRAAETALAALPPDHLQLLESYAAGVNEVIDSDRDLPPEFRILGVRPEPWTPLDSVVWTKSMAWLLSGSARSDALYDELARKLGEEKAEWFVPDYPGDGPRILPPDQLRELRGLETPSAPASRDDDDSSDPGPAPPVLEGRRLRLPADAVVALDELLGAGPSVGSNNWVVHGSRTKTGAPILSNDPHLGVGVPSYWFLTEIECPQFHVVGATFPGLPGMPIGHNEHIAWGVTNLGADVMDLVREQLDPDDPTRVRRQEGWETLETVTEFIEVKGRARPVELVVRLSSNGPLVSEFFDGGDEEMALRWTALLPGDTTVSSFLGIMQATDWEEFLEALELFVVPSQNFVYADRQGHIGWKTPGKVPLRRGPSGRRPVRGWVESDNWQGWIPFDELPEAFDPLQGYVATANNHPVPDDYPHSLGHRFAQSYRAARIIDLLEQGEGRSVGGHRAIQQDVYSLQAQELLPLFEDVVADSPLERSALETVRGWDLDQSTDSAGAALYGAWLAELPELLGRDLLDPRTRRRVASLHREHLAAVFGGEAAELCVGSASRGRPATSNCAEVVQVAFDRAVRNLRKKLGADPSRWNWGALHPIAYRHPLGVTPHLARKLSRSYPSPGGRSTVNIGSWSIRAPFTQTWGASYRQVVDLADWNRSVWGHAPGQSGVPWRAHFDDLAEPYLQGELLPMLFGREATAPYLSRVRQLRR